MPCRVRSVARKIMAPHSAPTGCQSTPKTEAARENLQDEAQVTVRRFERGDPSLEAMLNRSYGYAIFPSVGKGGAWAFEKELAVK